MSHTARTPERVNSLRNGDGAPDAGGRARSPARDSRGSRHDQVSQAPAKHQDVLQKLAKSPDELKLSTSTEPADVEKCKRDFEEITKALVRKIQEYVRSLHGKTVPLSNIKSHEFDAKVKILMEKLDRKNRKLLEISEQIPDEILPEVKNWQSDSRDAFVKAWNKGITDLANIWKTVPTEVAKLEEETQTLLEQVKKAEEA